MKTPRDPQKERERVNRWRAQNRERVNAQARAYRQANPERRKEIDRVSYRKRSVADAFKEAMRQRHLRFRFGITVEAYSRLYDSQGGVCAVCGRPETATRNGRVKRLAVDHNHTTGAIRGLLCQHCNILVGHAREELAVFRKAMEYIADHG